jgi:hypothetical protein
MSWKKAVVIWLSVLMASCGGGDDYLSEGGRTDLDMRVGAQQAIKGKLRDPDSAQFSNLRVSSKAGMDIVCGEVNSKNGFGGMGGKQQFISNGATLAFLQEEVEDGSWPEVWNKYC